MTAGYETVLELPLFQRNVMVPVNVPLVQLTPPEALNVPEVSVGSLEMQGP